MVHGKVDGINKLVVEAKANPMFCDFPKARLEAKIKDVAIREKRGTDTVSSLFLSPLHLRMQSPSNHSFYQPQKTAWYIKNDQERPSAPLPTPLPPSTKP
jgi:hypothetical protein